MRATDSSNRPKHLLRRNVGYFLIPPSVAALLISLAVVLMPDVYQSRHQDHILTGVMISGTDLSHVTKANAVEMLESTFPDIQEEMVVLLDPRTGREWAMAPFQLGLAFDAIATVDAAYQVGRSGGLIGQWRDLVTSWYYGRSLSPIFILDEGKLNTSLTDLAAEISQPAVSARVEFEDGEALYTPGKSGRKLDIVDTRSRLLSPLTSFSGARVELLVHDVVPTIYDEPEVVTRIQQMIKSEGFTFYISEPLDGEDLGRVMLLPDDLIRWLRVEVIDQADGTSSHRVFLDENAIRQWLNEYAEQIYRPPVNARFYFDDATRELVLVTHHVNGRELDVEATLLLVQERIGTPNQSAPFVVKEFIPTVNSNTTAAELGITELISEGTTWFRGSSIARKRNISQAAVNFFGIIIAPGEEFSFNKYLGSITEADGYEEGLIIVGGQTIKGIGGGVCQVSTTVFQTVFWAGFPVTERWQHGYMLGYYNDGEGPGMDATVFSPIVDFKFVNNTPYHLLIENYYDRAEEALTFKFYSTSMGRRVEKAGPVFEDIIPAPPSSEDTWQFDPDMEPGKVRQIDWATEGAKVTVGRTVYNANGEVILQEDFVSNYVPWANGYMYGSGVNAPDYSLVPSE